jgi:2',3'-cyclic-nucleotide 2'-phosphodiesterase
VRICIANGENAWDGKSISAEQVQTLRRAGVDVITGGNHTWDRWQIHGLLKGEPTVLRPFNYPPGLAGRGWTTVLKPGLPPVVVLNLQGRVFLPAIDCPFRGADEALAQIETQVGARGPAPLIVVDLHAEATAEKVAMAQHLDGRACLLVGTHTHVQTADERIFPKGLGYLTDAGMTGCHESVIGLRSEVALRRFLLQTPQRYESAEGEGRLQGLLATVDPQSRRTLALRRICEPDFRRGGAESTDSGSG